MDRDQFAPLNIELLIFDCHPFVKTVATQTTALELVGQFGSFEGNNLAHNGAPLR